MPKKAKRITHKALVQATVKRQPSKIDRQQAHGQIRNKTPLPSRNLTILFDVVFPQPEVSVVYTRP